MAFFANRDLTAPHMRKMPDPLLSDSAAVLARLRVTVKSPFISYIYENFPVNCGRLGFFSEPL
jgi:hypothetical protein